MERGVGTRARPLLGVGMVPWEVDMTNIETSESAGTPTSDERRELARKRLQARLTVDSLDHVVVPGGEVFAHRPPLQLVIIDDEDPVLGHPLTPSPRAAA